MTFTEKSDENPLVYFKTLDGFRGLAAIFILLFHSMSPAFSTLWIGVPMFFVLSGFLITRILIQKKNSENYLKTFYIKRSLRIFPIYYLGLLISVVWGLLTHVDLSQLPIFLVYLQNFTISINVLPDYCNGIMNHTWSLSAEEIFYLVWPLIILLTPANKIKFLCYALGISCVLYKIILLSFFYNELTSQLLMLSLAGNLDGLMAGALLGVLSLNQTSFSEKPFPIKQCIFVLCLFIFAVVGNYFELNSKSLAIFKTLLSVMAVAISFYVIWFSSLKKSNSVLQKLFQNSFMQFTGKISYGIYLYHALIFGITASCIYHFHFSIHPLAVFIFEIAMTYLTAILSWHFIEKPILSLKNKFHYSKV